ncbi:hypothetical protein DL95DRAFT_401719 [Leptodontidium sp. 2 PMI_412]|nr:hypothetical protein DL95DRAFT_401719 [Leptodontidium sp. 2 PMI_412]
MGMGMGLGLVFLVSVPGLVWLSGGARLVFSPFPSHGSINLAGTGAGKLAMAVALALSAAKYGSANSDAVAVLQPNILVPIRTNVKATPQPRKKDPSAVHK